MEEARSVTASGFGMRLHERGTKPAKKRAGQCLLGLLGLPGLRL